MALKKGKKNVKKEKKAYWPLKVLSDRKKLTTDAKIFFSTNATQSKLLALPAEVRNRIWRYVLVSSAIHVDNHFGNVRFSPLVCRSEQPDRQAAEEVVKAGSEIGSTTWQNNHESCFKIHGEASTRVQLSLSLLEVCRQIHSEASLIPFSENIFIFSELEDIASFAKLLIHEQRKAITSISFTGEWYPYYTPRFQRKHALDQLTGLRHLTLLIETQPHLADRMALLRKRARNLAEVTRLLKYVNWETVVVCLTSRHQTNRRGVQVFSAGECRGESREMEQTLLHPWDKADVAKHKMQEKRRRQNEKDREVELARNAKMQVDGAKLIRKNMDRTGRGLRKIKVASYGA